MQKLINLPNCRLLVIEVPEDCTWFIVEKFELLGRPTLRYGFDKENEVEATYYDPQSFWLPKDGNWKQLGFDNEITEEQAYNIGLDGMSLGGGYYYRDYGCKYEGCPFNTSLESLQSLLIANGIEEGKNYVLLIDKK